MAGAPLAFLEELESACRGGCDVTDAGGQGGLCVDPAFIRQAAEILRREQYFIEDVSPIDVAEGLFVVYHFASFDRPGRVALRALVPHENPELDSIASIFQGAEWHEREAMEMYGLVFRGNPNPVPLLLPEDMTLRPLLREPGERLLLGKVLPFCRREGEEPAEPAAPAKAAKAAKTSASSEAAGEGAGKGEASGGESTKGAGKVVVESADKAAGKAAGGATVEQAPKTPEGPGGSGPGSAESSADPAQGGAGKTKPAEPGAEAPEEPSA